MPRTRRTPAPSAENATPEGPDALGTTPVTPDATPAPTDTTTPDEAAKPIRRRGTRQPKAEAAPAPEAAPDAPAEDAAEAPAPARRRGRRTATPEPTAEAAIETVAETPTEAPAEPAPARRRGRRTAGTLEPVAEAKADADLAVEPPAVEPPAVEAPSVEAPTRRRGRRTAAEPEVSDIPAAAQVVPPTDAPTPPARRRGRNRQEVPDPVPATAPEPEAASKSSRRRRRGRGGAADAAAPVTEEAADGPTEALPLAAEIAEADTEAAEVGETDGDAEVLEETPAAPSRSSRRRRGRRQSPQAAAQEASAALDTPTLTEEAEAADVEAPVPDAEEGEAEETEGTETADDKRGRRGRRSRRRRGMDEPTTEMLEAAGSSLLVEETLAVEIPDEEDDDVVVAYPPPAAPTFVAPPLVARVLPPADPSQTLRVSASVRPSATGLARIRVHDAEHLPYFFFVNAETARDGETVEAQIREAAANGIHLFSGVMYLPLRNAYGDRSFGAIDALIQQVLHADPDGFILPRLQFFPTNYWARTHADQMARDAKGEEGDVSLASTEFWADCVDALEALIAHLADPSTVGGDRVLGFHLDRGEWFYDAASGYDLSQPNATAFQHWLHAKYQTAYALRAAWHDAQVTWDDAAIPAWPGQTAPSKKTDTPLYTARREGRWPDYAQFSSELVADVIAGLAAAVKTLSQNRMLVAVSYGYTLEFAGRNDSGHLALGRLLKSPDIDIVAGPNSYATRGAGSPAAFGAPLDSVALSGKLFLVEDDTKTFLADGETDDTYNPKISSGADTQAIHQRHFGAALAHRAGVTWMDLWGQGWLNSPDVWRELGELTSQAARWEKIAPAKATAPDVAVFVDEASLAYLKNDPNGLGTHLVSRTRDLLLRVGASVGFYLQSDVTRDNAPDARLYLFLNALRLTTAERQAVREKLQKPGKTLAWLYAAGLFDENGPSAEEVGEVVGMTLRAQPWNSRGGSQVSEVRHPLTERLRSVKRLGQDEILNPLYAVSDPQATVLAEYAATGATSLAAREHKGGWKSVFFGDPYLTAELLRGLYAYAGIPAYDSQDDVTYAGEGGALTLHGTFTGQRTVNLPRRASVYDVFENKIVATDARSFRTFVRAKTTRLFLWGDGPALSRATGLDLPAKSVDQDRPEDKADASTEARPEPQAAPRSEARAEARQDRPARAEPPRVSAPPPPTVRPAAPPAIIPGLEPPADLDSADAGDEDESSDPNSDETSDGDGTGTPSRRSRWQRRRASIRARKEAERQAQLAGTADPSGVASPPVDMATLLPGLPPRRTLPSAAEASDDADPPASQAEGAGLRIAGIVDEETAAEAVELEDEDSGE